MSLTLSGTSRSRSPVGIWALLLSVTAATLAAVLGIHALGEDAFSGGVRAASSVTQAVSVDDPAPRDLPLAPLSAGDQALTGLTGLTDLTDLTDLTGTTGHGGALACALLALLCVATLALALLRTRAAAARALDPLVGPGPTAPPVSAARPHGAVDLTALGISRI